MTSHHHTRTTLLLLGAGDIYQQGPKLLESLRGSGLAILSAAKHLEGGRGSQDHA